MYDNIQEDPYNVCYNETFDEINELSNIMIKKITVYNNDIENRINDIKESFEILDKTIQNAISDPKKFNLTKEIIMERISELDKLKDIFNNIINYHNNTKNNKKTKINNILNVPKNEQFNDKLMEQIIDNQEIKLDMINDKLQNVKRSALLISHEIGDQEKLLDEITDETNDTTKGLRKSVRRLDEIIENAGSCKIIIMIIFLILILMGLIILIFYL